MRHVSGIWHPFPWRPEGVGWSVFGGGALRLHKLIQEPQERERSAVITCGSLVSESTSRICVYFSLFPKGAEASCTWTASHPNYMFYLNAAIFSPESYCYREDQMAASLFVFACFSWGDACETTACKQREQVIICLNMSLTIVVVMTK